MTNEDKMELRRLYPELSDEELVEAEETLTAYAKLLVRMIERRHSESEESNGGDGVK